MSAVAHRNLVDSWVATCPFFLQPGNLVACVAVHLLKGKDRYMHLRGALTALMLGLLPFLLSRQALSDDELIAPNDLQRVSLIVDMKAEINPSDPPQLRVTAIGQVPTGGWSHTQLVRRVYVAPPADGIWEYDLLSRKPTGIVSQMISQVEGVSIWKDFDTSIKGVRVYGIGKGIKEVKVPTP